MYAVMVLKAIRGSSISIVPFKTGEYSRLRDARGQAKALRNSQGEVLLQHFHDYTINYFEYEDYYVFLVEDDEGIHHEVHIYLTDLDETETKARQHKNDEDRRYRNQKFKEYIIGKVIDKINQLSVEEFTRENVIETIKELNSE
jgi:hypothetical protein